MQTLDKYCLKTPAELPAVISRIARDFYVRHKENIKNIPKNLMKIPEDNLTKVMTAGFIARDFKECCKLYNLPEAETLSYLTIIFIKKFKIESKSKHQRQKLGGLKW